MGISIAVLLLNSFLTANKVTPPVVVALHAITAAAAMHTGHINASYRDF
jgi:hypothetical protein